MKFFERILNYYKECSIRFAGVICIRLISFQAKAQPKDSLPLHMSQEERMMHKKI